VSEDKPRVLWVCEQASAFGGSFESLLEIWRRVDDGCFEVAAAAPGPGSVAAAFRSLGATVCFYRSVPAGKNLRYLSAAWSFRRLLARRRVDVVYFPNYETWRPPALVGALWAKVPVVVHLRSPADDGLAADPWLGSAAAIIGNSQATLAAFRGRLPEAKLHVVYNFVDFDRFGPGPDLRRELAGGDHPLVGFVGIFRPEKAVEDFLEMARIVRARRPEVRFAAVGGDSPRAVRSWWAEMKRRAVEIGVADVVRFTGPRADVPTIMRSLDVLVVPSLNEGFGRVILEANAVGKPVVGSAAAGIPEVIEDGVTGLLAPPRDPQALASAVLRILEDGAWRARVAAVAPARVRERFSPRRQVAAIEEIWRGVVTG
jgi:glycosyltransferase involved in cell wall biosynthesis